MMTPLPINDPLRELIYLLLVKFSTFRVLPGMCREPCPDGELQISTIFGQQIDGGNLFDLTDNSSYTSNLKSCEIRENDEDLREYFYKACRARKCFPQDYEFWEVFIQTDIYCSVKDDVLLDEANYVRDALNKFYIENSFILDKFRIFLFHLSDIRDYSGYSKVAPSGLNKVSFDINLVIGILKD